jgi:hypothetical protein
MVNSVEYKQAVSGGMEINVVEPQIVNEEHDDLPF